MVVLRKKDQPIHIKDYRPIGLMHSVDKLVAKLLATRLSRVLNGIVHHNQSTFIRGRGIHDNFKTVQFTCRMMHKKKTTSVLLKIDIARTFDLVSWPFLLEILQFLGFSRRWRDWMSTILSTASTKILLNGHPVRRICHARGLR